MTDGSACLAYVHSNEVAHSWHKSVVDLLAWDISHEQRLMRGGFLAMRCGTGGIVTARNEVAERFLAGDAEWLFWIDTDMGFAPDTLDRLVAAADPVERPIVGALCFAQQEHALDGMGGHRTRPSPTLYRWVKVGAGKEGFTAWLDYPRDQVVPVAGTGSACIVIHRSALESVRAEYGPNWYTRMTNPSTGQLISEDLSFCAKAAACGLALNVDTSVKTSHLKPIWLAEEDYTRQDVAAPAAEATAVIVPVMRRPRNAEPFMRSLRASTGLAKVYAICDNGDADTTQAWRDAGADTIVREYENARLALNTGTFAEKVNAGYAATTEPWLFMVGDDVRFQPGWLDHAQQAARQGAKVVGTNDLGNPRVTSGEHGTHLLISREYIDELGASWDGPGLVCHEGYRHWYVDDEIVTVAKQRGVWTSATESIVEHLHPAWGKAATDSVYELGQSYAKQDYARFRQRLATHAPEVAHAS